jgi:hypothetical protein
VEQDATTDAPGPSQAGELGDNMGPGDDTDKLNQVGKEPRLTGPGVKASKQSAARTDAATLGRELRTR